MKRALLAAAAGLAAGCAGQADPATLGKGYFQTAGCAVCHAVGPSGPDTGTNLGFAGFAHKPEWLETFVRDPQAWKPGTRMPKVPLAPKVREALVAYLATLKGQAFAQGAKPWDAPALKADPVKRGEALYRTVGCQGCHGHKGAGGWANNNVPGNAVPALTKAREGYNKDELKKKIRVGVAAPQKKDPAGPEPLVRMPAWGEVLTDDEIDALADYVLSLGPVPQGDGW